MPVRIEEIIQRIRREIAEEAAAQTTERATPSDFEALPRISERPEREYLNRNWALFDPQSGMRSHRRILGPVVLRFKWWLRRLVLGCGGGEVLQSLDGAGSALEGVEASASLVAECHSRGFAAKLCGLRSHIESVPEESLGGLIVTRVAERHPLQSWPRLVAAAWRSLRSGGKVLCEGLPDQASLARLRWLLARQRFAIVEARAFSIGGGEEHVIVGQRGEEP